MREVESKCGARSALYGTHTTKAKRRACGFKVGDALGKVLVDGLAQSLPPVVVTPTSRVAAAITTVVGTGPPTPTTVTGRSSTATATVAAVSAVTRLAKVTCCATTPRTSPTTTPPTVSSTTK